MSHTSSRQRSQSRTEARGKFERASSREQATPPNSRCASVETIEEASLSNTTRNNAQNKKKMRYKTKIANVKFNPQHGLIVSL